MKLRKRWQKVKVIHYSCFDPGHLSLQKQSVRRNTERFPDDFMFELTKKEQDSLRSQTVILKRVQHSKSPPFAFAEQGVAMLSSVLNSDRAITVSIAIMRTFIHLRTMIASRDELKRKIAAMENKYDEQFRIIFEAITQLIEEDEKQKKKIGYIKERQAKYGKRTRKNRMVEWKLWNGAKSKVSQLCQQRPRVFPKVPFCPLTLPFIPRRSFKYGHLARSFFVVAQGNGDLRPCPWVNGREKNMDYFSLSIAFG